MKHVSLNESLVPKVCMIYTTSGKSNEDFVVVTVNRRVETILKAKKVF